MEEGVDKDRCNHSPKTMIQEFELLPNYFQMTLGELKKEDKRDEDVSN
jgi:hypothetical protein